MSGPAASGPAVALHDVRFAYRGGRDVIDIPALEVGRGERLFLHLSLIHI